MFILKMLHELPSFLAHELQLITGLLLICGSYISWNTKFIIFLNIYVEFSIFESVLFLPKFMFLDQAEAESQL